MGDIINLSEFQPHAEAPCAELSFKSDFDKHRIETVRDHIENMLEDVTQKEDLPLISGRSSFCVTSSSIFSM